MPRLRDRVDAWERELRTDARELAHTLPDRVLDAALATVRELGRVQPETLVHGDLHAHNILRADREPWLAVDPKGYVGDPAYDGGTLLKSRFLALLEANDLSKAVHRALDLFAEAAELDRERVGRWAQFHAVEAAFHGRRHGFRVARGGRGWTGSSGSRTSLRSCSRKRAKTDRHARLSVNVLSCLTRFRPYP